MVNGFLQTHSRAVDISAAVVALVAHAALAVLSVGWIALSVMTLDPCAYVECGDERWAWVGIRTAQIGGGVLVLADLVITGWRLTTGRRAWFVPILFCIAQIVLAAIGFEFMSAAGPV